MMNQQIVQTLKNSMRSIHAYNRSMATKHVLVDTFASKPFTGNPASVIFKQGTDTWMQSMAEELNIPVTAFVSSNSSAPENEKYSIRW